MAEVSVPLNPGRPAGKVVGLTLLALLSFALNSLLCRAALGPGLIDAASFTLIRLAAGAAVLALLATGGGPSGQPIESSRKDIAASALALFLYALPFSLAYRGISAGTGAFVLFGTVQVTMIGADLVAGGRLRLREGIGLALAVGGLTFLTRPGVESPDPLGVCLMMVAGVSWGVYSLRGRRSRAPLAATARNFAAATPMAFAAWIIAMSALRLSPFGLLLATLSGALTSGLGYVAWYSALPSLPAKHAAMVQLSVPPLASLMGILFLQEPLTIRLLVAAPLILGGIAIAVLGSPARRVVVVPQSNAE